MGTISDTRLYASSIAIVSGVYAIGSVVLDLTTAPMRTDVTTTLGIGGWIMLAIGVVVLVHGVLLLTPAASAMRRTSGRLMITWAAIMLIDQWLLGMTTSMMGMAPDAGMIAVAILMLASGLIMTRPAGSRADM